MRVLIAGATGAIGRQLVPLLAGVGHSVIAVSRNPRLGTASSATGVVSVRADALNSADIARAVYQGEPDVVVNLLTAIPPQINPKRMAQDFEATNRLRTEGTRNLLAAADNAGVGNVISEGLAYGYDPSGDTPADEDAALWVRPPAQFRDVLGALRHLEERTAQSGGLVLRFGHLYGPGTSYAADGSFVQQVRAGKVPLVGSGSSVFSFIHVHDAATAIVAAIDRTTTGVLNVVDDDPAPMSEWLPYLAAVLDAPKPKKAPAMLARLAVGGWGVAFMTQLRGADNARARLALDWRPRFTSWREGFAELTGADRATADSA